MFLIGEQDPYPDDILVYIESIDREKKTILLDFTDSEQLGNFQGLMQAEVNYDRPSMLLLRNYNGKRVQPNTTYRVKKSFIEGLFSENAIRTYGSSEDAKAEDQASFVIGYTIDLANRDEFFGKAFSLKSGEKLFRDTAYKRAEELLEWISEKTSGNLTAIIRDVGQANWNEIWKDNSLLMLYDAGAPSQASKTEVLNHIGSREHDITNCTPGIIVSHWDLDHYHSLAGMSDATLSQLSFVICRSDPPTHTSQVLYNRLTKHLSSNRLFDIPAEDRVKRKVPLKLLSNPSHNTLVFNAHYHKDRNRSGILFAVRNTKSSIVFPGDAYYSQISDYILPHLQYPHTHHLVVPHHGGEAGKFKYDFKMMRPANAIISVGVNSFNHPKHQNINSLSNLRFRVSQTRIKKQDIAINL